MYFYCYLYGKRQQRPVTFRGVGAGGEVKQNELKKIYFCAQQTVNHSAEYKEIKEMCFF